MSATQSKTETGGGGGDGADRPFQQTPAHEEFVLIRETVTLQEFLALVLIQDHTRIVDLNIEMTQDTFDVLELRGHELPICGHEPIVGTTLVSQDSSFHQNFFPETGEYKISQLER